MADNTNVNNNAAVVVVGRTAPVPPGQQKSEKSIPVVIANDQSTIPVAEQNKVASEVALSLLGIPRSEVALGIFADVNTYDVNPTEWSADPEQYSTYLNTGSYVGVQGNQGQAWGLSHVPSESGALLEAPGDKTAVLTSKRFFRYQPGRVSAATFGVKTTTVDDNGSTAGGTTNGSQNWVNGGTPAYSNNHVVANPAIRKYGIFDKYDGYYWETRNDGAGDNFCVVRRTQSVAYENPVVFGIGTTDQQSDYGRTNPPDPAQARASESTGAGSTAVPTGYTNRKFGDLCILRDNLLMSHAGVYDPSLLQKEHKKEITSVTSGAANPVFTFGVNSGIAASVTNAVYDINTGIMVVTTNGAHGFNDGQYITLAGIGMTCRYSYTGGDGSGSLINDLVKFYPINEKELNIIEVPSATSFKVNVGVSTVPTFYHAPAAGKPNGWAIGLSAGQHVSYSKGPNVGIITGLGPATGPTAGTDGQIFKVRKIGINTTTGITTATFNTFDATATVVSGDYLDVTTGCPAGETGLLKVGHSNGSEDTVGITSHFMITPVPFIQPISPASINASRKRYGHYGIKTGAATTDSEGTAMFPYMYTDSENQSEGYINSSLNTSDGSSLTTLKGQIDDVNNYYRKWVNQNVAKDFWNVYEYRIPRSRFSGDRLDGTTDKLLYSDVTPNARAGQSVLDENTGAPSDDVSIWDLEFDKVTMYKIEFSWYGAVGALFLAYVPVSSGEARWVRVHHLRASNQLKVASLGNATLPITYMCYGGGTQDRFGYLNTKRLSSDDISSASQHIVKYGASYYIDGGDRGTVKLFSYSTPTNVDIYGSMRKFVVGSGTTQVTLGSNATSATAPYLTAGATSGLSTSYYIGSKVQTGDPLDQNIEVTYVDTANRKLYLNAPLNSGSTASGTVNIISNRPTPLIGLKCRDEITSSTGQAVRNRTQVYPTRMSTGSTGLVKLDMIKSPKFQTTSLISGTQGGPTIGAEVNIGRRGKPTKVSVPLTSYQGTHTWQGGTATGVFRDASNTGNTYNVTAATYDSTNGQLVMTATAAGTDSIPDSATTASRLEIKLNGLTFSCSLDGHATNHTYPRAIDPIFDNSDSAVSGTSAGGFSKHLTVTRSGTSFTVNVTGNSSGTPSAAEYIRDTLAPSNGTYGWFRGYFASDSTKKPISVLGYLENRGSDRTKNIETDGYYFSALDSTVDDIILTTDLPFLREENSSPTGNGLSSATTEFTLAQLSSVKVNPQVRSPIPGTGTIVASLYAPATGEEFDLSSYFDYNKEYLSFPLTDSVESLYLCGSTQTLFDRPELYASSNTSASISASLTWEEQ